MRVDIGERTRDLNATRHSLAEETYKRKKDGIARRLKRLIPAGTSNDISVLRDSDGELQTEPSSIARALTQHWQHVFNQKATDANLRKT